MPHSLRKSFAVYLFQCICESYAASALAQTLMTKVWATITFVRSPILEIPHSQSHVEDTCQIALD